MIQRSELNSDWTSCVGGRQLQQTSPIV